MIKRKRGRPKGSKNKPKKIIEEPKRKRGRPKKIKEPAQSWGDHEGISWVARKRGPQSDTHRWVAVFNNEVIGYYKTPEDAAKAYNENQKTNSKEN
jgi:ABC-type glycerol-3-phosphate transport system substrate-binding protein